MFLIPPPSLSRPARRRCPPPPPRRVAKKNMAAAHHRPVVRNGRRRRTHSRILNTQADATSHIFSLASRVGIEKRIWLRKYGRGENTAFHSLPILGAERRRGGLAQSRCSALSVCGEADRHVSAYSPRLTFGANLRLESLAHRVAEAQRRSPQRETVWAATPAVPLRH